MATVVQTIIATPDYVPFERPPDNIALWTAIPRGLLSFIVDAQVLDAKLDLDDQILQISANLPRNFAYVMQDCNFSLTGQLSNWKSFCNLNIQSFYRCNADLAQALNGNWLSGFEFSSIFSQNRVLTKGGDRSTPWPVMPMVAGQSNFIQTLMSAANEVDGVTSTGFVNYYISFWQYDLEQIRKFPINTGILTY